MKKTLVYYCISLFSGCLSALLLQDNFWIGAAFAASFLAVMVLTVPVKYSIIITAFFFIGFADYNMYFNPSICSKGVITIRVSKIEQFKAEGVVKGRKISLKGNIKSLNPGETASIEGTFSEYPDYSRGVIGEYDVEEVKEKNWDFIGRLYRLRKHIYEKYSKEIGDRKAGLIAGACFGDTSYLDNSQRDELSRLGIVHIVSVSGMHMSLIYKLIESIIGYQYGIIISLVYVLFTGAQAATARAFIMIVVLKLSKALYKKYDCLSALALAAMILLLYKPYYICEMGFMLSFLSVFGIETLFDRLKRKLYFLPSTLNEGISLSLSAQSFSAPYAMLALKSFSPGFIPGNILLLPLYSALVVLGNISLLFINVDFIFRILVRLIDLIIIAVDGGTYLLLKITPPVVYMSIIESWCIIILYLSYMLYKNGKKKALYLPLITILMIFSDNYKFNPEVEYITVFDNPAVIIRYKGNSVLILEKSNPYIKEKEKAAGLFNVDRIECYDSKLMSLELGSNFKVNLEKYETGNRYPSYDIEIISKSSRTLITEKNIIGDGLQLDNYDIIYLKNDDKKRLMGQRVIKLAAVRVFFNKVYVIT